MIIPTNQTQLLLRPYTPVVSTNYWQYKLETDYTLCVNDLTGKDIS